MVCKRLEQQFMYMLIQPMSSLFHYEPKVNKWSYLSGSGAASISCPGALML